MSPNICLKHLFSDAVRNCCLVGFDEFALLDNCPDFMNGRLVCVYCQYPPGAIPAIGFSKRLRGFLNNDS